MTNKITPPKKTKGDYVYDIAKAVAGTVPMAGSLLAGFIETIVIPPYQKKNEEYMSAVVDCIEELKLKVENFNIDDLKNNTKFQDAMLITAKAAMATSSEIKRQSLLNALQNIALNKTPDQITTAIFLHFIDRFNEAHIQICCVLDSPNNYRAKKSDYETKETYRELINKILPKLGKPQINIIVRELHDNELISINIDRIDYRPPIFKEAESCVTPFGKEFIAFINKPSI